MDDEHPTVQEDIGYRRPDMQTQQQREYHMHKKREQPTMKRIRYTTGTLKDRVVYISGAVADDLIERGYAVAVDREPGEDDE